MTLKKIIGVLFIAVGILFAILGSVRYVISLTEKGSRIYSTARIVRIDERKTGDPEFPIEHTTYVELDLNSGKTTAKLNTYAPDFKVGKEIDIYYFDNDLQMVYEVGSDSFYIIFSLVGLAFAALGALLAFRKSGSAQECAERSY